MSFLSLTLSCHFTYILFARFSLISTLKHACVGAGHALYVSVSVPLKQMRNKLTILREISKFVALELTNTANPPTWGTTLAPHNG
jgi:hypothetical protein